MAPRYEIVRVGSDFEFSSGAAGWPAVPSLTVGHYLWSKNSYAPPVEARLCYNERFLFVRFLVEEGRVRARFTRFQDPVYKDSCVELFVDAFPDLGRGYLNLEANALGTLLAAFGPDRHHRAPLTRDDLRGFRAAPSLTSPVDGEIAAGRWTLAYRVPLGLFRKLYGRDIVPGQPAAANFYKCGDETEFPHYGVWSAVGTPTPDFHRPEFFGTVVFGRSMV